MIRFHSFHTYIYGWRFTASRLTLDFYNLGLVSYSRKKSILILFFEQRYWLRLDIFHPIARKSSTVFRRRSNTFLKYRSQTTTTMFEISVKFFSFSFFSNFFLFLLFTEIPSSRGICCTFVTREVEKRKDCIKGRLESKEIFVFHSYKAHIFPRWCQWKIYLGSLILRRGVFRWRLISGNVGYRNIYCQSRYYLVSISNSAIWRHFSYDILTSRSSNAHIHD